MAKMLQKQGQIPQKDSNPGPNPNPLNEGHGAGRTEEVGLAVVPPAETPGPLRRQIEHLGEETLAAAAADRRGDWEPVE